MPKNLDDNRCGGWSRRALAACGFALATALTACGGGHTSSPPTDAPLAGGASTLGVAGGTVGSLDGAGVAIPAQALATDTTIRIARDAVGAAPLPPGARLASAVYAFSPHGIDLERPALVSVPLDSSQLGPNDTPVLLKSQPGGDWVVQTAARREGDTMVVDASTFSYYVITVCNAGDPAGQCWHTQYEMTATLTNPVPAASAPTGKTPTGPLATLRRPQYVAFDLKYSVPTTFYGTHFRVYKKSAGMSRPVALLEGWLEGFNTQGTQGTRSLSVPVTEADNGTLMLYVEASCDGVVAPGGSRPWCVQPDNSSGWPALAPYTAASNLLTLTVDIPKGTSTAGLAPMITTQPADVVVTAGADPSNDVAFTVETPQSDVHHFWQESHDKGQTWIDRGSYPLNYDTNVQRIPAEPAKSSTYRLADGLFADQPAANPLPRVSAAMDGWLFRVRLDNAFGTVTSRPARLVVSAPVAPVITVQPQDTTVMVGQTASFNIAGTGLPAPLVLQWYWRAPGASAWTAVPRAGAGPYTLQTAPLTSAYDGWQVYAQFGTSTADPLLYVNSAIATLHVVREQDPPVIVSAPQGLALPAGSTAVFAAGVMGTAPLSYQWSRDGVDIPGANTPVLTLSAVGIADDGAHFMLTVSNLAGTVRTPLAALSVGAATPAPRAPVIVTAPASLHVGAGASASLAVAVDGSGPLGYQWLKDGQPVGGATGAVYTIAAAAAGDAGSYAVTVSNAAGSVTSAAAALAVDPAAPPAPPTISTEPATLVVAPGAVATLAVAASGGGPLRYQWHHDDVDVPDATSAVLRLGPVSALDAGRYSVTVSNDAGSVVSSTAQVMLLGSPAIVQQPAAASVVAGATASFAVVATGDGLLYQWLRDGLPVAGATAALYTTPPLSTADSGATFSVIVFNGAGLQISQAAHLSVSSANVPGMRLLVGDFSGGGGGGAADGVGTGARLDTPQALAYDGLGHLYVATSNTQRVVRIDLASTAVTTLFDAGGVDIGVFGTLAIAPGGSLYAGSMQYCGMYRIDGPTSATPVGTQIRLSGCTGAGGLAVDSSGAVFVANPGWNAIWRMAQDSGGAWSGAVAYGPASQYTGPGSQDWQGNSIRFDAPHGLAFDADGNLWVADTLNHTIRRITPAGVSTTPLGTPGLAGEVDGLGPNARFDNPMQLAFDPSGNLIVLDGGDASNGYACIVRRVTPAGAVSTLFNASDEAAALGTSGQQAFARAIRGLAVLDANHIALTAGNAVVVRTLP